MKTGGPATEKVSILDLLINESFNLDKHGQQFIVRSDRPELGKSRKLIKISKEQIEYDGAPCEIIYIEDQTSDLLFYYQVRERDMGSSAYLHC